MFQNHSATGSINQYYHGNVGRTPLTPNLLPQLRPVERKGNYAGGTLEQGKAKEHLNIYKEQGGRVWAPSWFH